jgi:GT2 family glycosyltransferase
MLDEKITLMITTKDRLADLAITLSGLAARGFADIPLLIVNDGSDQPIPSSLISAFKHGQVFSEPISLGLIVQRNRMLHMATTEYVVSLDDDSILLDRLRLEEAVALLDADPTIAVGAFPIYDNSELPTPEPQYCSEQVTPGDSVQTFVGCGFIARRSAVLAAGGFRGYFFHMGEETDLSLRLYKAGQRIAGLTQVITHHRRTPLQRSQRKLHFYRMQNRVLTVLLNYPIGHRIFGTIQGACSQLWYARGGLDLLACAWCGIFAGLGIAMVRWSERTVMSADTYKHWRSLPTLCVLTPKK